MKVTLLESTPNPIELIYRSFRICYSSDAPTEIKIPTNETCIGDINDKIKMCEFIKDKLDKGHNSPLEHVSFSFAIEGVSRALTHQLVRHRTFKFSQQSQRYVNGKNFDYVVPNSIKTNMGALEEFADHIENTKKRYQTMIRLGVLKEDARSILPNSATSNIIVTCDLRNFRHFYMERNCVHAQEEIKALAKEMMKLVRDKVAFADYKVMKCGLTCHECS